MAVLRSLKISGQLNFCTLKVKVSLYNIANQDVLTKQLFRGGFLFSVSEETVTVFSFHRKLDEDRWNTFVLFLHTNKSTAIYKIVMRMTRLFTCKEISVRMEL